MGGRNEDLSRTAVIGPGIIAGWTQLVSWLGGQVAPLTASMPGTVRRPRNRR